MQSSFFNIFWIWLSWFFVWTQSNISSAWYGNQNFFFFFFTTCLLRAMTHTINSFLGWSTISYVGIVLKRVVFWSKGCSYHFCQQERVMAQRVIHTVFVSKKRLWLKGLFIPFLSTRKGYGSKGCSYRFCQQERVMA